MANIKRASGSNVHFVVQLEDENGVQPTDLTKALKLRGMTQGESLNGKAVLVKSEEINGIKGTKNGKVVSQSVDGSIPMEFSAVDLSQEILVYAGMGELTQTSIQWNGKPKFKKVYKRKEIKRSLTVEKNFADIGQITNFHGLMVNNMSISLTTGGLASITFDFIGQNYEFGTVSYAPSPVDTGHVAISSVDAKRVLIKGTQKCANELTITIDNGLTAQTCMGTEFNTGIGQDLGSVTGTYTTYFENSDEFLDVIEATIFKISFRFFSTDDNYVEIHLPSVQFDGSNGFSPNVDSSTTLTPQMTIAGNASDEEGTDIVITYVNDNDIESFAALSGIIPVIGVQVTPSNATRQVGQTLQLTKDIFPSNATNKNVTYQSDDETIATVSSTGLVTAVAVGTVDIFMLSAEQPLINAACELTVTA